MLSLAWGHLRLPIYTVAFGSVWGTRLCPKESSLLKGVSPFLTTIYTGNSGVFFFIFKHFIYKKLIYSQK